MKNDPSDEVLNAWIDGELDSAETAALLDRMRTDATLRERACQQRLTKELVCHAYASEAPPRLHAMAGAGRSDRRMAAVLLAAISGSALLGWAVRDRGLMGGDPLAQVAANAVRAPIAGADHIVVHLSTSSPQDAASALDRAEGLLETARTSARTVSVEIVANGGGLDLLREGVSAYPQRIARLRGTYPGLALVACGQTVQRLRDGGADVQLLPGTSIASSALDQVVLRMQQGWAYVKI